MCWWTCTPRTGRSTPITSPTLRRCTRIQIRESWTSSGVEWLPWVTRTVRERSGWEFFQYGNIPGTWGMKGEQGWYTFDHRPRFTTNYVGIRNRFGILSEAYSYASFEERILAHGLFVEALLDYASQHASRLRAIVNRADARPVTGTEIALSAELQRGDTITILMGEVREERNPYSGQRMLVRGEAKVPERMPDYTTFPVIAGHHRTRRLPRSRRRRRRRSSG